jgi:hypothetical protein
MKFLVLDWDGKKLVSIYNNKKYQRKSNEQKIINDWRQAVKTLGLELYTDDTNVVKGFNECVEYTQLHGYYGMLIIADRQAKLVDFSPLNTKEIYETAIDKAKYCKNDPDFRKFFTNRIGMI